MHTLKLTQVGNSVGAIFPQDLLARRQLEKCDERYVTETPDGLRITTHNPVFEAQMWVCSTRRSASPCTRMPTVNHRPMRLRWLRLTAMEFLVPPPVF